MKRWAALLLLVFAAAGPAGGWTLLPAPLLLAGLVWLPGAVVLGLYRDSELGREYTAIGQGPGSIALQCSLGLALLTVETIVLFAAAADLAAARFTVAAADLLLAVLALLPLGGTDPFARPMPRAAWIAQWRAMLAACAILLPAVVVYAGGTIDDWWDGGFVLSYVGPGPLGFADPLLGSGRVHPRFLFNVWLVLQALVLRFCGGEGWDLQARWLAPFVCVASVSALAFFASSVFRERSRALVATVWFAPAWLYGTEAFPFFTRLHQDKFVAVLVVLPVILGLAVRYLRRPSRGLLGLLAAVAVAGVCVHGLVYCIAVAGVALSAIARLRSRPEAGWAPLRRVHLAALLATVGVPAVYPIVQRAMVFAVFAAEGIGLDTPDNPVVRAHLWLDRLLWPDSVAYIVNPAAVFGPVAVVALAGLVVALRRRRCFSSALLLALTVAPCAAVFTPFVAAAVGHLWVPWMLYRLAWLVPVAALLGLAVAAADEIPRPYLRRLVLLLLVVAVVAPAADTGIDRLRRDMRPHPFERAKAPRGDVKEVYSFLRRTLSRGVVMAPPGLSDLVPAFCARPVVAISERGTLVFSGEEATAYRRLADRAAFYSQRTDAAQRMAIARRWGVQHAVFGRRAIVRGEEDRTLRRFSAEGFLRIDEDGLGAPWSAQADALAAALPPAWRIVFSNDAFFVVRTDVDRPAGGELFSRHRPGRPAWLAPFELTAPPPAERAAGKRVGGSGARRQPEAAGALSTLAAVVGSPGARITLRPVPLALGMSDNPVWASNAVTWESGPSEVEITLDMGVACEVAAVDVSPYQQRALREVFEVRVGEAVAVEQAVDAIPIRLMLPQPTLASSVTISIRSLLGTPLALSNARLLGDSASCRQGWPLYKLPLQPDVDVPLSELLDLALRYPHNVKPYLALARLRGGAGEHEDAAALLAAGLDFDPSVANAWVELGRAYDELARPEAALAAYRRAARVDSHNAWARGSLGWAYYLRGRLAAAAWEAYRAEQLDPRYGDAHTIMAYVERSLGQARLADRSLAAAIRIDPLRNWAYLARADFAMADGRPDEAKRVLAGYLERSPYDEDALVKLRDILFGRKPEGEAKESR